MIRIGIKIRIREYITANRKNLFRRWLCNLPIKDQARVQARLFRFESGNPGDFKSLSGGLFELKMTFSGGIRVYFGTEEDDLIMLLGGGSKQMQSRDVCRSRQLWDEYLNQKKAGRGTR